MRPIRAVRQYPLVLLAAVAFAFVAWIWWDALPQRDPVVSTNATGRRVAPVPFEDARAILDADEPMLPDAAHGITKLRTGMTRAEVEKLIGAPAPDRVSAAVVTDGRVTYLSTYEADFGPPQTVRPLTDVRRASLKRFVPPVSAAIDRTLVMLEFDATKPGHPLLGIHYSDPLF
jgi:hypothetical protein